ncbi:MULTISPECIES: LacI family DNA-binding transcriptional regulator [Ensifer]|jgi:DNA-binding LacI/PurR family transcriptional regulator|uniref:Substrate-binding domain-containing protein n=1 Tax=Ensifer canadensis TaxID=555315 RepID=A0AAW4FS94_9HYPH|nr:MULTISPECIES: LacI family DNA-binding transcriptional regulator [Ensifer]MDP9632614.1 DNA-binding LacI/PurR family transcriptional regulator [Ensifer adhaerens]KQU94741.1 LacI family transcriptional regulator [Ensifer sp. Root31]KQW59126.1 LacI family transcriptional regulator [Ensifer sp. Root1252]KQW79457.1 LacI family transcriptional regulator [Ensifer sp. Root127]KQY72425.1 LacI family transcriptional regulator [Ensifer sp. Root142]
MARGFVTAEEVAKRAGVSRSAVSRTFTPGASVSQPVRRKVLKAARELGYRVNRLAQGLNNDRSNLIGVVGTNLSAPFISKQLDLLSIGLLRRGLQCLLLNAADARKDIAPLIELLFEFRAQAIVVLSGEPPSSIVDECIANGVRLILVNQRLDRTDTNMVLSDDSHGADLAALRLIAAKCKKVAVVSSASQTPAQVRRATAFTQRMQTAGIEVVAWSDGPTSYESGYQAGCDLLRDKRIDGAFCVTDLLALGFLDAARIEMHRRVPQDVSVVGFDDIPQASWKSYELTTIEQSLSTLTANVLTALETDEPATRLQVVPVSMIERKTVR